MRSQQGLTLVELLIAMSVTAAILVGIAGVVQVGEQVANHWSTPVRNAATANQLADWLEQDSHRYRICQQGAELDFCEPYSGEQMVSYGTDRSTCPCDLVRQDRGTRSSAVLARGLEAAPGFTVARGCESASVTTGMIVVSGLGPDIDVAFRAPKGGCPNGS